MCKEGKGHRDVRLASLFDAAGSFRKVISSCLSLFQGRADYINCGTTTFHILAQLSPIPPPELQKMICAGIPVLPAVSSQSLTTSSLRTRSRGALIQETTGDKLMEINISSGAAL
jgi:hypothetical protein